MFLTSWLRLNALKIQKSSRGGFSYGVDQQILRGEVAFPEIQSKVRRDCFPSGSIVFWGALVGLFLVLPVSTFAEDDSVPSLQGPLLSAEGSDAKQEKVPPVDTPVDASQKKVPPVDTPVDASQKTVDDSAKEAGKAVGEMRDDQDSEKTTDPTLKEAIEKFSIKHSKDLSEKGSEKATKDTAEETSDKSSSSESAGKAEAESSPAKKAESLLGDPLSQGKIKLLMDEIVAGISKRQIGADWSRWQSYAIGRVNASAGKYTGSELTGNCRLSWYDRLMRNVLAAPAEAERFTRDLHKGALGDRDGFAYILAVAAQKMDLSIRKQKSYPEVTSPEQAMSVLKQSLLQAQVAHAAALAPLTKSQIRDLETNYYRVFVTENTVGHTLNDRGTGRRLCDTMEVMDRDSLHAAADALIPLTDTQLLQQLKNWEPQGSFQVPGVTGEVVGKIETPCGTILVGGKGTNVYQLDKIPNLCAVVDLGGNDTYIDGVVGPNRPVMAILDLAGNDVYRSSKPGVQGGAVLGVSILLDLEGDDVYDAQNLAQASAIAGVGILIDYQGSDRYVAFRRAQGHALGGLGILIDKEGNDDYRAALWAQGLGGPLGFGMLDDLCGNDHYYCGGMWPDSYPETPGCEGWGQGVGGGIRQVANGGIGLILDGAGDDVYEFDYLSHGGGYWCGLGFARDFGGNDQRLITRKAYDGSQRTQPSFQRFGCGWGCHYALGFCFDDSGDDLYEGTIMGSGMAWDCSMGVLCDFAGSDRYKSTGGLTQGTSQQMGFGVLFDYDGDDQYDGTSQGYAATGQTYHPMPDCGGNFAFLVDYGGKDKYGCGAQNNTYIQRGMVGGFLIDRPRQDEIQPTADQPKTGPAVNKGKNQVTARKPS